MTNTWTITAAAGDHRAELEREAASRRLAARFRRAREMEREIRLLDALLTSNRTPRPAHPGRQPRQPAHSRLG
jgi:hypothetical protein